MQLSVRARAKDRDRIRTRLVFGLAYFQLFLSFLVLDSDIVIGIALSGVRNTILRKLSIGIAPFVIMTRAGTTVRLH